MSVVNECLEGDSIYSIVNWWSIKHNNRDVNIKFVERQIHIGEELIFIDAYLDKKNQTKPYSWKVKFRCLDGYIGEAAHSNFVTSEEWENLKEYFLNIFQNEHNK